MDRAYLASSQALSVILCVVGVALVATTLARGGGPLALGVIVGVLFAVLGAARLRLARAMAPDRGA
ncbi:MAG: hypothetical protein ACR2FZ_01945 [Thermoleophilaceae bacterium]|nr:hypothetical protein [Thermoleophilaceae bacterium]